jgi:hypothetical protein
MQKLAKLRGIREQNLQLMQRVQKIVEARRPIADLKMEKERSHTRIKLLMDQLAHMQKDVKQGKLWLILFHSILEIQSFHGNAVS